MARNVEKSNSMLNRWRDQTRSDASGSSGVRPYNPKRVTNLREAESWRRTVAKEIDMAVRVIENPGMDDDSLKAKNDEINDLVKTLYRWEKQIMSLGGAVVGARGKRGVGGAASAKDAATYVWYGQAATHPLAIAEREAARARQAKSKALRDRASKRRRRMDELVDLEPSPSYYGFEDEEAVPGVEALEAGCAESLRARREKEIVELRNVAMIRAKSGYVRGAEKEALEKLSKAKEDDSQVFPNLDDYTGAKICLELKKRALLAQYS